MIFLVGSSIVYQVSFSLTKITSSFLLHDGIVYVWFIRVYSLNR